MIEINLVPDVKQELIKARQIRSRVITVCVLVGVISTSIVVVLALYVFTVQTVRGVLADNAIETDSKTLLAVPDLSKTLTIQNQLTKIPALNDNRNITSRIFGMLTSIIPAPPNNVKVSTIKLGTTANAIEIEGQASAGFAALESFKKTIDGAKVKYKDADGKDASVKLASDISTSDVSYGEDSSGEKVLRFKIGFTVAAEMYLSTSKNVSVVIANGGNVTDSFLGVPKSIFADKAADITEDK